MRTKAGYTSQMKARYTLQVFRAVNALSRCFSVPTKMINNNSLPRVQYPAMKNKQTEKKNASDQDEVNGDIVGVGGGGKILNGNNQKGIYIY